MEAINDRRRDRETRDGSEDPELERESYLHWLAFVQAFRSGLGVDDYVPWDIRDGVNDVEQGVGLPQTVWNLKL